MKMGNKVKMIVLVEKRQQKKFRDRLAQFSQRLISCKIVYPWKRFNSFSKNLQVILHKERKSNNKKTNQA